MYFLSGTITEIDDTLANLDTWARPEDMPHPMMQKPGKSIRVAQPKVRREGKGEKRYALLCAVWWCVCMVCGVWCEREEEVFTLCAVWCAVCCVLFANHNRRFLLPLLLPPLPPLLPPLLLPLLPPLLRSKGVVLILGAWNFPVNLSLVPLLGAIAAGEC